MQDVVFREALVDYLQEFPADISCDAGVERGVKPDDISAPPLFVVVGGLGVVFQSMVISTFL